MAYAALSNNRTMKNNFSFLFSLVCVRIFKNSIFFTIPKLSFADFLRVTKTYFTDITRSEDIFLFRSSLRILVSL